MPLMIQIGHCDAWLALYGQLAPGWSYQWALVMSEKVNASTSLMLWMKQEMWPSDQVRPPSAVVKCQLRTSLTRIFTILFYR